jgi:predicted MFS family arabinose efflux permease
MFGEIQFSASMYNPFLVGVAAVLWLYCLAVLVVPKVRERSRFSALVAAPVTVAAAFAVLLVSAGNLIIVLGAVALWGIGISATVDLPAVNPYHRPTST